LSLIGTKLAAGRTAEVFDYGPGRVVKLYREGWPETLARAEYENTRCALRVGLPAPHVFEVAAIDGRGGVVFGRVDGEPLTSIVLKKPWRTRWAARLLAELHVRIHSHRTDQLPSLQANLEQRLTESADLEEKIRSRALETLRTLPEGDAICHGDFHSDNVLVTPEGAVVIDWADASSGPGVYDFVRTWLVLSIGIPEESDALKRLAIRGFQAWFARLYAAEYRSLVAVDPGDIARWSFVAAAVRLTEGIPAERDSLVKMLAR
jgi:Ser/Thr protein kinase RdoA (MazF antagonist)